MMFSRNRDEELELAKEKAKQDMESERLRLERERQQLDLERERLEKLRSELDAREDQLEKLEDELEDLEEELDDQEEELEGAESVREIFDVVSERMPTLMRGIEDALTTPEAVEKKAKSLAMYYKTLVEAGMDKGMAESLVMIQASEMNRMVGGYRAHHVRPHPPVPPVQPVPPVPPHHPNVERHPKIDD
jgi:predicted nuclease with TOPRIM domain